MNINRLDYDFSSNYLDLPTSLHEMIVERESSVFICRASGRSMEKRGIFDGDILIVNRSLTPRHNDVVVVTVGSEFMVKIYDKEQHMLRSTNPEVNPPIPIPAGTVCEGVIENSIRMFTPTHLLD